MAVRYRCTKDIEVLIHVDFFLNHESLKLIPKNSLWDIEQESANGSKLLSSEICGKVRVNKEIFETYFVEVE